MQLGGSTEAWATPTKTLFESTSFFKKIWVLVTAYKKWF
jgi:hypothetical protein